MKRHEFFKEYANLPLYRRLIPINSIKHGFDFTPINLYIKIKALSDKMRPDEIEMNRLLKIAEEVFLKESI